MPTTTLPALDGLAQAVPLIERLRSVPPNAVLRIDTPNTLGVDTRSIPVGRLCHEAAESLEAALAVPAQQGKWLPKEPTEAMSLAGEQALMARAKPLITWAEHLTHVWVAMYDAAAPAAPGAAVPAEPDMLAVCAALGFDPTNHHNAAKCPYCSPVQPGERELPPLPRPLGIIRMTQMGLPADLAQCAQDIEMWAYGIEEVFTADQLHDYARAAISSVTKETKK